MKPGTMHILRRPFIIISCLLLAIYPARSSNADSDVINILVLHSYHQGLEWTDSISAGIVSEFNLHPEYKLDFQYLDAKKHHTQEYLDDLVNLYHKHRAKIHYDAIIASDNAAYNFLIAHRDALFSPIPVFFCGVNYLDQKQLSALHHFYGYEEFADHTGTLEMIKRLFPERNKVLIINDNTTTGKQIRAELEEALLESGRDLNYEFFTSFDLNGLRDRVKQLDGDYVIYLLVLNKDKSGNFISYKDGIRLLKNYTDVPIFGSWDFYLGKGIIGGSITSGGEQGRNVARLARSYFEHPETPLAAYQRGSSKTIVDYHQLAAFGVDKKRIPDDYEVIHAPPSFFEQSSNLMIILLVLFGTLLLAISILGFKRAQNKKLQSLVKIRTAELEESNNNLESLNKRKNEILGIVAHDLRNPIGNIHGLSSLIVEQDQENHILSEKLSYFLKTIQELSETTLSLVNDLLDISVIESGTVKLNVSEQDYIAFLKKEIKQYEFLAEKKRIQLILETKEEKIMLSFDKTKMQQVIGNLLSNAIKFSGEGSYIEIYVSILNVMVLTKIKDYGCGIARDKIRTIFKSFVHWDHERSKNKNGTGLGLFIAKGIVEAHKGRIYVESQENFGTTFFYELPLHFDK